ncbi:hypothetical protein AAVH_01116 [Aphelenchoides avenae]|nr:hypothetical protein AAVH_01116 [Aphelenchus avenae]
MFDAEHFDDSQQERDSFEVPEEIATEDDSLAFMGHMAYISFAHVLLFRRVIPVEIVEQRNFQGFPFFTFNQDTKWGAKLHYMMVSAMDATKKKILKEAHIVMTIDGEGVTANAVEMFSLQFAYNKEDGLRLVDNLGEPIVHLRYQGRAAFASQIGDTIKRISAATGVLKPLPQKVHPQLQLTLHKEYEWPGLKQSAVPFSFPKGDRVLEMACLETPLHKMLIKVTSCYAASPGMIEALMKRKVDHWESSMEEEPVDADGTFEETEGRMRPRASDIDHRQVEVLANAVNTSQRSEEEDPAPQAEDRDGSSVHNDESDSGMDHSQSDDNIDAGIHGESMAEVLDDKDKNGKDENLVATDPLEVAEVIAVPNDDFVPQPEKAGSEGRRRR